MYKAEIEMIKSHMNLSNEHMLQEMIDNRINKIKQLNCGFCEENCNRPQCFTNRAPEVRRTKGTGGENDE